MQVAVYARKSTEQTGVADEQKSVARQIDHARSYAVAKGWTVDDAHVYVDDGISGAEFANRPGFLRLMNALKPRPPFQALVMSEESRLGREAIETSYALKQLVTSNVRVFFYLEDRERTLNTPMEKAMLSLQTMSDEMERDKARMRVTDAMVRKARAGHVTGGKTFGYDNVEILDAAGKRSHVARVINPVEAAVVRRIFALSAAGTGYTRIAKLLNAEHAPAPRPKAGRLSGWSPSTAKVILDRRLYLGEQVWNRTQKRNTWGQKRPHDRPESEWIRTAAPTLRIVTDADWRAAHGRVDGIRARLQAGGAVLGNRRARDIESAYLLSGFARCASCGGSFGVMGGSHTSARAHVYGCLTYHKRGKSACSNGLKIPIDRVDDQVRETIHRALRPAAVLAIIDGVMARLQPQTAARDLGRHRTALQAIEREIGNLAQAIAIGGQLDPLLVELRARQARRDDSLSAIAALKGAMGLHLDRQAIDQRARTRLDEWRTVLTQASTCARQRQLLREVLAGPLLFTPEGRTYRFAGEALVGRVLAGAADVATFMVPVRGSAKGCTVTFTGVAA